MLLIRIALRNLVRRGRKTLVVALLIAAGVAAFFLGNAVLETSIGGIQRAFAANFTADLSISQKSDQSFSLFGPDVPVIGDYETLPVIVSATQVGEKAAAIHGVESSAYVLTTPLLLEADGARASGLGVGAIAGEYFSVFRQPRFVLGGPPSADAGAWAVISDVWASELAKTRGRPLAPGEKITLSVIRNQTFTIREATLAGVVHYDPPNAALDHLVVTDGRILRALCGYSQTDASPVAPAAPGTAAPGGGQDADLDALFSGGGSQASSDRAKSSSAPISVDELKDLLRQARTAGASAEDTPLAHDGPWHFILLRLAAGANKARAAADLRRELSAAGFSVQVRDWRGTAGGAATYVFLMQIVLYVGIFMLGGIVLILTINSLVMSVFERTSEIGTMRAIGARRGFVQRLFIVETSALTLISGVAGLLAGFVLVAVLDRVPLKLTNQILVLLFGGTSLHPGISAWNALVSVLAALVLGLVAWIYPVRLALRIQPVRAIQAS